MPEHFRSLIVIMLLALPVFMLAKQSAYATTNEADFKRRRNLWFFLTITAFLSHNFWLYAFIAASCLFYASKRDSNSTALFFSLVFLIPAATIQIPGFGLINYLFDLGHTRLLSLIILMPAFFNLASKTSVPRFGKKMPDKILAVYLLLITVLLFSRQDTVTNTMRGMFYLFIDIFLPYYVFSRAIDSVKDIKDTLSSYINSALVLGAIGAFEISRHWLLYRSLLDALGINWGYSTYLPREGLLRASASTGHPIPLGYVMVVAIGFYLSISPAIRQRSVQRLVWLVLLVGVVAPLSRGPWLGLAALITTFIATRRNALRKLFSLFFTAIAGLAILTVLPGGNKILDFLPFIGSVESSGIDYRQRLIDNSIIVILSNPFFGTSNYLETPEMQALIQGQGIIDITNTYLGVALNHGLVGLGLFLAIFLGIALEIYRTLKKLEYEDELHLVGRSLLATIMAILLVLATVSSITIIQTVYWSVAGLGVAYLGLTKQQLKPRADSVHHTHLDEATSNIATRR